MKKIKITIVFTLIFILFGCELNINSSDECLECSYRIKERTKIERVCNDLGSESEMDEMRDNMQEEADSLGVTLSCKRY